MLAPVANLCLTSHQGWRHKLQQQKSKTQDNKRTQLAIFFSIQAEPTKLYVGQ